MYACVVGCLFIFKYFLTKIFSKDVMMLNFSSKLLKTDVTSIKVNGNEVFVGIGNYLLLFSKSERKLLQRIHVFDGESIQGIVANPSYKKLLIFGANRIKTYTSNHESFSLIETNYSATKDWILAAEWIDGGHCIATVSMHNILTIWTEHLEKIKSYICTEKCLLYSAFVCCDGTKNIIVLSGTVFSEILIWHPIETDDGLCPVLHRLVGHKGVIFSVCCSQDLNLICSTSDDRSAILWSTTADNLFSELEQQKIEINLVCQVYGHSARVFRCLILNDCFITSGEDSVVNIWSFQGKLIRKIEAHQGGTVWALDYDKELDFLVTGGGDCGVNLFKLKQNIQTSLLKIKDDIVPKQLAVMSNGNLAVLSEEGLLFYYILNRQGWKCVDNLKSLEDYALLEVSNCRKLLAFAGGKGNIFIYKDHNNNLKRTNSFNINNARIYSLHWLTCSILVTCGPDGVLNMWLMENVKLKLITRLILPYSKERWSTTACLTETKNLVVGDRKGNIHLFCLGIENPIQTIKKAHNHLGVTFLMTEEDKIFSFGRNGVLKTFKLAPKSHQLSLMSSDKISFSWLAKITKIDENYFVLGFSGEEFIIWDYHNRKTLLNYSCGGGHRSWDLFKKNNTLSFIYIKNKTLHLFNCNWSDLCAKNLVSSFHSMEVNCIETVLPTLWAESILISGGEDTTLRLSKLNTNAEETLAQISVFKSHLSSIRAIHSCKVYVDCTIEKYLVFTGGGRAQIVLWELVIKTNNELIQGVTCSEKYSYYEQLEKEESEIRIMDLTSVKTENFVVLFAACSDGKVKIYLTDLRANLGTNLRFYSALFYKLKCIIKICNFSICECNILVTMATDGKINFWNITDLIYAIETEEFAFSAEISHMQPFYSIKTHQSGINSYSYKILDTNNCVFLTGGDDNAIVVHFLNFKNVSRGNLTATVLNKYFDVGSHSAQVTGACIVDNYFITTSIDQKVLIYKWDLQNNVFTCDLQEMYKSSVADIHGMQIYKANCLNVVIYGKGIEVLQIVF